ncbi:MAG TPA: Uma2 family endonuclease [Streptosporangiaceae bacterium]|nr:Uma2 family endonuclease [Streptosporangiaceae bacterium]
MAVVSIAEWPAAGRPFTVDELDRMPDDGRRYELIDGVLTVSPAPIIAHQVAVMELSFLLKQACPERLYVLPGPAMMVNIQTELIPDIVVVLKQDLAGRKLTGPPALAVEVQSPSTRLFDLNQKKSVYEKFGVPSYWIVVPDPARPQLMAFELRGSRYVEVAHVTAGEVFAACEPFPVEVVPARLVAGLPPG